MKGKVLILNDPESGRKWEVSNISRAIKWLGGSCLRFGYEDLLFNKDFITIDYDRKKRKAKILLNKNGRNFILNNEIISVLNLFAIFPQKPKLLRKLRTDELRFMTGEWRTFMWGVWLLLRDRLWLNPHPNHSLYEEKCYQLQLAQQIGFSIPETLISTSLKDSYRKLKSIKKSIIHKTFSTLFYKKGKEDKRKDFREPYTTLIDTKDLIDKIPKFQTPSIFQIYVPKKVELRVVIVGDAIFATEIHSQESEISKIDWRHYDLKNTPYLKHRLPVEIKKRCLQIVRELGLSYAAIDMILTPKDEYVFLELNPSGRYGWIERLTKYPITENIARMLLAGSVHYDAKGNNV